MCKDCKGITLIKGEDGVGIVNIANNPNGTITVLLSNGTSYTTTSLMGPAGATGAAGTNGVPGGWSSKWSFSTAVTSTPVATKLQFNNVNLDIANIIYINKINITNTLSLGDFLNAFANTIGGVNYYGLLRIYNAVSPETNFWMGKITGYTTVGSVAHVNVTMIQREGVFLANDNLIVDFTANGEKGATPTPSYKVYSALITQSGTAAPSALVLENTLSGAVIWTRTSTGLYLGTLASEFVIGKTWFVVGRNSSTNTQILNANSNVNNVILTSVNSSGVSIDSAFLSTPIEIRVYN